MNGDAIPVFDVCFARFDEFELLLRIVDKRAEFFLFRFTDIVTKEFIDLSLDVA